MQHLQVFDRVLVIHHTHGDEQTAANLCEAIKDTIQSAQSASTIPSTFVIVHNAAHMESVSSGYREHFIQLERDIAASVSDTICYIPAAFPRLMAKTVAFVTRRPWQIFARKDEFISAIEGHVSSPSVIQGLLPD
jgi:hypothetical protein